MRNLTTVKALHVAHACLNEVYKTWSAVGGSSAQHNRSHEDPPGESCDVTHNNSLHYRLATTQSARSDRVRVCFHVSTQKLLNEFLWNFIGIPSEVCVYTKVGLHWVLWAAQPWSQDKRHMSVRPDGRSARPSAWGARYKPTVVRLV